MGYFSKNYNINTYEKVFPYFYGMMSFKITRFAFFILLFLAVQNMTAQDAPPVLTASGNQIYCPGTPINIVTSFNITDADDSETNAIYIQISSGYVNGQDILTLNTTIPNITSSWNAVSGKLTIQGTGGQNVPYTDLITAVENVMYNSSSPTVNGSRTFSITMGQANYLPSTGHYYQYISSIGISWTAAEAAAQASTYYGLQGYLVTILSQDEAQLVGEQALGTGWIGGTDAQTEGTWRWVTGPEAGTIFWQGAENGSTPNFAFWNTGEPNNLGEEDYAHITAPGVGIPGSWNDLPVNGSSAPYVPQGYIVEYGGMPGDPVLQISASTSITIPAIEGTIPASQCGSGSVILQAVSSGNGVYWYNSPNGGTLLATGSNFTTPILTTTTTYYVSAYDASCTTVPRTAVVATINEIPTLTVGPAQPVCGSGTTSLNATPSIGSIQWYTAPAGGAPFASGNTITSPVISTTTTFYAEAVNNGCLSATREVVTVIVNDLPNSGPDVSVLFCDGASVNLDATTADVLSYVWSTGETSPTISITEGGTYTVTLTNAAGCSAVRTYNAIALPETDIVSVETDNTTATVIMADGNPANYEYSLDGVNYQNSATFINLSPGRHTAYARSLTGCGLDDEEFVIYIIPKFFTPNGDTINDVFTIAGMYALPEVQVTIFDRYGKTVTALNNSNPFWDGTYKGNSLPANDYWYIIRIDSETPEVKGHFSLVR